MTTPLTNADLAKEVARREALAAAYAASAKQLREELDRRARTAYAEQGVGVSWKVPDLGRITLPLSEEAPVISDIEALTKWVRERHPEEIQTVEQVRAAFQTWLLQHVEITTDGDVITPDGEIVPGMAARSGGQPKSLTITVDPGVKRLFATYAADEVARQLTAEFGEQVPDVAA
jgi:hypothetical protein